MGYQAEKEKIELDLKRVKAIALAIVVALLAVLCVFSAFVPPETWKYYVNTPALSKRREGELRMHFLDVGQGDCSLIEFPDGKVALIDGGDASSNVELTILRYLNALHIDVIDYLIVTHADKDHCGSLSAVVKHKKILNAYLPTTETQYTCAEYKAFYKELLEEDCTKKISERYLTLGTKEKEGYDFLFLYPYAREVTEDTYASNNESSAVLWLDYHGASALFMGDAPYETEDALMRDHRLGVFDFCNVDLSRSEILKVAHHGSASATGLDFLKYLQTETAVISCGENNPYGHPHASVLSNLQKASVEVARTDINGTIMITMFTSGEYALSCR